MSIKCCVFLVLVAVFGVRGVALAAEPASISDRWRAMEVAARDELNKYPLPAHKFADVADYRAYQKDSAVRSTADKQQLLAKCKELVTEGNAHAVISAEDHLALAVLAYRLEQYDDALQHAEEAARARPDDPRACLALMVAQVHQKDFDGAEKTLARVVEGAPLPDEDWVQTFLLTAHNSFRRTKRPEVISRSQRWILDVRRALNPQTAAECNRSFIVINLATSRAALDGWGELALSDLEREKRAWETLAGRYSPWMSAKLFAAKILVLDSMGKKDDAQAMLRQALDDAERARTESPQDADACLRWIVLEQARIDLLPVEERAAARKRRVEVLDASIRQFPGDAMLLEYGQGVFLDVSRLVREERYEEAIAAKDALLIKLHGLPTEMQASPLLLPAYAAAFRSNSEITRSLERKQLVGKPAPAFEVDGWTNGPPVSPDDVRGKVVLVDFWAVWCGPCVASFPKLIDWQKQYAEKGLVTVGITKYYGRGWDAQQAQVKLTQGISHPDEQGATAEFAKHHGLTYSLGFDTEDDKLFNGFGVEGIPQIVLVDRKGIVRLVCVGKNEANDEAIVEMIEKLLAE